MKSDIQIAQGSRNAHPIKEVDRKLESERMTSNYTENTKLNYPMN